MEFDVVIVGAGPAGLAAAIRLKQLSPDLGVVVVEKGSEVGAHILSGAVIDPIGLDRLLPEWRTEDTPIKTAVQRRPLLLARAIGGAPSAELHDAAADVEPRQLHRVARQRLPLARHQGRGARRRNLSGLCRDRSADRRTARSTGVATGDMGIGKDGKPRGDFTRGMELRAKYTLFAEGARGSLSKQLIAKYGLADGREPQKFGLGLKELWQVAPDKHRPGLVQHSFGWPLDNSHRRRLVPLSLRRQSGFGRLRRSSQLLQSVSVAVRGIPALQDPSADPRHVRRRQAAVLRRARHHRRRLPVGAEACRSRAAR